MKGKIYILKDPKSRNYFWKHLKNKVNNPKFKYKDIVQSTQRYVGIKYLCSVRKNILYKMRSLVLQDGYVATIYILVVRNTVDEDWLKKVLQDFNNENIEYISSKNYE